MTTTMIVHTTADGRAVATTLSRIDTERDGHDDENTRTVIALEPDLLAIAGLQVGDALTVIAGGGVLLISKAREQS